MNSSVNLDDSIAALLQSTAISDLEYSYFSQLGSLYKHYYNAMASPENFADALDNISSEVDSILENSDYFALRALASSILMKESGGDFPIVDTLPAGITQYDIVLYPSAQANKKNRRTIPEKVVEVNNLTLYPNPASDFVNLQFEWASQPETVEIKIIGIDGRVVLENTRRSNQVVGSFPLSLQGLANGVYVVTLESNTGESSQQKLVVNK